MKKEWLKPEVKSLNLGNTNEEGIVCPADEVNPTSNERIVICAYPGCCHFSGLHKYCTCHRPAAPGMGPVGPVTPELDAMPLS